MKEKYESFEEWWFNGNRFGENEPHCFHNDCPSDAWLAKEAWQAAREKIKNKAVDDNY